MRDRGILRARIFFGGVALFSALITWATAFMMSPHGDVVAKGTEHVRNTVVVFLRNSSIGTLALCALAAWLLFPARRPKRPAQDWTILILLGVMVLTSLYQLFWVRSLVH